MSAKCTIHAILYFNVKETREKSCDISMYVVYLHKLCSSCNSAFGSTKTNVSPPTTQILYMSIECRCIYLCKYIESETEKYCYLILGHQDMTLKHSTCVSGKNNE